MNISHFGFTIRDFNLLKYGMDQVIVSVNIFLLKHLLPYSVGLITAKLLELPPPFLFEGRGCEEKKRKVGGVKEILVCKCHLCVKRYEITKPSYNKVISLVPTLCISLYFFTVIKQEAYMYITRSFSWKNFYVL